MAKEERDERERDLNVLEPVDFNRLFCWLIVHYICLKSQSTHKWVLKWYKFTSTDCFLNAYLAQVFYD